MSNDDQNEKTMVNAQLPAHLLEAIDNYDRDLKEKRKHESQARTLDGNDQAPAAPPDKDKALLGFQQTQDLGDLRRQADQLRMEAQIHDDPDGLGGDETMVSQGLKAPAPAPRALERHSIGEEATMVAQSPVLPASGDETLFVIPELKPLPTEAEACFPGPAPAGLFGSVGYAIKFRKAVSQINGAGKVLTQRGTTLNDKKQDVLADLGQKVYEAQIRHPDTAQFDAALETTLREIQLRVDQKALMEGEFASQEAQFTERNKDKLAGRDQARDTVNQLKSAKEMAQERFKSADKEVKLTTKAIESGNKKVEKLQGATKKPDDWQEQVNTLYQQIAESQNKLESVTPEHQALTQQLATLTEQLTGAEAQLKALDGELTEEENKLRAANKEHAARVSELENDLRHLRQQARESYERIGYFIWSHQENGPQFVAHYNFLNQLKVALDEDKQQLVGFEDVRARLRPGVAKKGMLIMLGGVGFLLIAIIVTVIFAT